MPRISDADVPALIEKISNPAGFLGEIDLSGSEITDLGLIHLVRGISDAYSNLRQLNAQRKTEMTISITGINVSNCKGITYNGVTQLADLIENCADLESFKASGTELADDSVGVLCDAFQIQNGLETLELPTIGRDGLTRIIEVVKTVKTMASLKFSFVDLENVGELNPRFTDKDFDVAEYDIESDPDAEDDEEEDEDEDDDGGVKRRAAKEAAKQDRIRKMLENDAARSVGSQQDEPYPPVNAGMPTGVMTASALKSLLPMDPRLINGRGDGVNDMKALKTFALLSELALAVDAEDCSLTEVEMRIFDKATGQILPLAATRSVYPEIVKDIEGACADRVERLLHLENLQSERSKLSSTAMVQRMMDEIENGRQPGVRSAVPIRSFLSRSIWSLLSRGLYELQRHKSRGNRAVQKPEGEIAFLAMYIRKHKHEAPGRGGQILNGM